MSLWPPAILFVVCSCCAWVLVTTWWLRGAPPLQLVLPVAVFIIVFVGGALFCAACILMAGVQWWRER